MPRRLRVSRLQALTMTAASGAYAMAGFNADLVFARRLTMQCTRGIYQISGYNVNLSKQKYTMTCTRGLFTMTGRDATFTYTPASTLGWLDNIFPMSIAQGSFFDLSSHITGNINEVSSITANVSLPSGVAITNTPSWRITATSGATVGSTSGVNLTINPTTDAGWNSRISQPGVVWYHNFDSAAEVTQFRWSSGYSGGNDPLGLGTDGARCLHVASGGADGGGFMRLAYPAGSSAGGTYWWRPFNPLTGATNGRGINDPGANGTLTPLAWPASNGSSTTLVWSNTSNPGYYGHSTDVAANPSKYQGTDYYLQVRVRRAVAPGPAPDTGTFSNIVGKNIWPNVTTDTSTAQEIVFYGQSPADVIGTQSRARIYEGVNRSGGPSIGGNNMTTTIDNNDNVSDWRFSGGWDTILIHVTPGTNGGTGTNRTRLEVWAQRDLTLFPAEAGTYTKIWDVLYSAGYSTGTNSSGGVRYNGWNAIIFAIYHNGAVFSQAFNYDYDQVIFSKNTIAAPTS
jgi:hypothetical protein